MSYSFVLDGNAEEEQIALVRNETEDVSGSDAQDGGTLGTDYVFTDERIGAFLRSARLEAPADANETEVRLMACGAILDVLATNQSFILKKQRTLHEETDGPAVGLDIRKHAASCKARALASLTDRRKQAAEAQAEAEKASRQYWEPMSGGVPIRTVF